MQTNKNNNFEKIKFLGEGQFATVYQAKDLISQKIVAIKKLKMGLRSDTVDGINRTALKEIKYLQELNHPNLITLLDVLSENTVISLVFDFMDTDLEVIIKDNTLVLSQADIKAYIIMALRGLEYLHKNWILHRDIKPNNLLVDRKGILKLADLGLAKYFGSPNRIYTNQVVTRWYRSPELLFGAKNYGTCIDIWAMGCVLAELLLRIPIFPGESDLDQLSKIFEALGTPNTLITSKDSINSQYSLDRENSWSGVENLPDYISFKNFPGTALRDIFTAADSNLLELLKFMFAYDPLTRWDCTQCLKCNYFYMPPIPTPSSKLPIPKHILQPSDNTNGFNKIVGAGTKRKNEELIGKRPAKRLFVD
ncbi:unnamed protein product [Gordionus sp. m RMFG-2023]|uniref:cyclin-dependent kinase 7-like n=1 Tax=Gordionus sp. m RMFG-2023 TaxID=3053472 RepID=UPI0030DF3683